MKKSSGIIYKKGIFILFCFLLYSAVSFDMINMPIDDVYISLRYVWNFINGNGLTFNPGEFVEGYSNPTWVVLISSFAKILNINDKFQLIILNRIVSFIVLFCAYIFFYKTFRIYVKDNFLSAIFLLFLCVNYPLNSYALAGMEIPLVLFFLSLFIFYYSVYAEQKRTKHIFISSFFLGLLSVSRPEGIIYLSAFMLSIFIYQFRYEHSGLRISIIKSFSQSYLAVVIFVLFIIFRLFYYSELMPNTAAAKNYFTPETLMRGFQYILAGIFFGAGGFLAFGLLKLNKQNFNNYPQFYILILLILLGQFSFIMYTGWDWMASFRFVLPVLPLVIFILFMNNKFQKYQIILLFLIVLLPQTYFQRYFIRSNWAKLSGYSEIRLVSTGYNDVSLFLNKIKKTDDLMLIQEAGYVPYATDIKTLDLCGLTDKHLASIHGPHFKVLDLDYTLSYKNPTIIVTFQTQFDEINNSYSSEEYYQSNAVLQSKIFRERYKNIYFNYGIGVFVFNEREIP